MKYEKKNIYMFIFLIRNEKMIRFLVFELIEKYYYLNNKIFDIKIMIYLNINLFIKKYNINKNIKYYYFYLL